MASPIQELIENTRDGFVLLSEAGEARYTNAAAKTALGDDVKYLASAPTLVAALKAKVAGTLKLPFTLKLDLNGGKRVLPAVLIHAPVGNTLALLVQPATAAVEQPALANVLELLRGQLLRPVKALVKTLQSDDTEMRPDPEETLARLREVTNELDKIVEFAAVFGEERLDAADRIIIKELVTDVWRDVSALAQSRDIETSMTGFAAELPPLYGNRDWLMRVVRELLDNAIRHSKVTPVPGRVQKTQLEISARQMGPHIVLSIRNAGVGMLPKIADRKFLPFNTATAGNKDRAKSLSIGLPLVHKLVELHGGRVKIELDGDDFTECVVELPTGAPQHDMSRLDLQQAKRYAEDLGKLMARRKKAPAAQNAN